MDVECADLCWEMDAMKWSGRSCRIGVKISEDRAMKCGIMHTKSGVDRIEAASSGFGEENFKVEGLW